MKPYDRIMFDRLVVLFSDNAQYREIDPALLKELTDYYQQALFNAVSQALSRKPNATFDRLAGSPAQGNAASVALNNAAAKRNAEDVLRTLTDMGISSSRIQLLTTTDAVANNEVQVFVR